MSVDLVVVTVGGVQRFIGEARSTADVSGASDLLQRLLRAGAAQVATQLVDASEPYGLIFPAGSGDDAPASNKLVFLVPGGEGAALAEGAADRLRAAWRSMVEEAFVGGDVPPTPGVPDVAWVAVTGSPDEYDSLWATAQHELAGRRRARVFAPYEQENRMLCAQSPGLPSVPPPANARSHERDEKLSAAGWVKRWAGARAPSTASLASAWFRSQLLAAAASDDELRVELASVTTTLAAAVRHLKAPRERWTLPPRVDGLDALRAELGPWVYPSHWDVDSLRREFPAADPVLVGAGRSAAARIIATARAAGIAPPSPYLAILAQDLDRLGRALGRMSLPAQRAASAQLSELAGRQRELIDGDHPTAHLVYTGGDDLLAFCPAHEALALAAALRAQVREAGAQGRLPPGPDGAPVTASTGVVFVHMSNPLQDAVDGARRALGQAKSATDRAGRSRDAVCVVVRRRGGERAATVQPWWPVPDQQRATDLLDLARPGAGGQELSAGLAGVLERDAEQLDALAGDRPLLSAEIERLVLRQGGTLEIASALVTLGRTERVERVDVTGLTFRPVPAALVARFLSQEAG